MENGNHGSGKSDTDSLVDAFNSPLFSPTSATNTSASNTSNTTKNNSNGANQKYSTNNNSQGTNTIPSIHLDSGGDNKDPTSDGQTDGNVVSSNQEIQTLLLILLAQVCALHDSTPKTFVVHVLSLYERGILEYESIAFIFDMGLVPAIPSSSSSLSPTARLANFAFDGTSPDLKHDKEQERYNPIDEAAKGGEVDRMAAIIPYQPSYTYSNDGSERTIPTNFDTSQIIHQIAQLPRSNSIDSNAELRSKHVYAIRRQLESYHQSNSKSSTPMTHHLPVTSSSSSTQSSWSVEHHPLSLSRYNREFIQKRLLAAGSFGQVFQSMNKLDNVDYAIKRVAFSAKGYDYSQVEMVIREVQCLAKLGHENVVRYYTSWLEPSWMTGSSNEHDHDEDVEGDCYNGSEYNTHDCTNRNELLSNDVQKRLLNNFQRLVIGGDPNDSDLNGEDDDDVLTKIENELRHVKSSWSLDDADDQSRYSDEYNSISEGGYGGSECSEWTQDFSSRGRVPIQGKRISNRQGLIPTKEDPLPKSDNRKSSKSYRYQICLFIQMQLCQPSTLADWIRERNANNNLSSSREQGYLKAWDIFQQIANGLSHVHSKNVVHRDLKPANIFHTMDESADSFKIGDFGLSKLLRKANNDEDFTEDSFSHDALVPLNIIKGNGRRFVQEPLTQGVGTSSYAAPEQLQSQSYGSEADVFSLGLILLELFSSFDSEHERAKIFHDCRRGILPNRFIRGDTYLQNVGELILACTSIDPKDRPTAAQIVELEIANQSKVTDLQQSVIKNLRHKLMKREEEIEILRLQLEERNNIIKDQQKMIEHLKDQISEETMHRESLDGNTK